MGATLESDKLINLIKIELRKENAPVFPEVPSVKNWVIPLADIIESVIGDSEDEAIRIFTN